ncbi:MAG: aminoacyl-histidine dipeptidase [Prolixibacteraceae bacterium]|nr:aminoacyl-histidine dipeptidase [Prolixibacteraceae bacterium]
MNKVISHLNPEKVWGYFEDICQVPRPSKHEEKIIAFMIDFAHKNGLKYKKDTAGNILIYKPASQGYENRKKVVLQSHLDMVCEKNNNTIHNFDSDPIIPRIEGGWVKASGTTLGADCGIGMAVQMAVLTDKNLKHGPIECLFTVDEETGLTGAKEISDDFISGEILINLDSEDEGELFIGCAGGVDTLASMNVASEAVPNGFSPLEINVAGLIGGHSGDDIDKGRGNAIKILVRFLWDAYHRFGIKLAYMGGGNLRNAIAREANATIMVLNGYKENLVAHFNVFKHEVKEEYEIKEPGLKLSLGTCDVPGYVLEEKFSERLLNSLYACPHGVQSMSFRMPGMVETSTNLASVKMDSKFVLITTSQRSDRESCKTNIASMVEAVFLMANAVVQQTDGYPGWSPNPDSEILKITSVAYKKLFKTEPVVRSIHAGLECGLFLEKYPHLDMISFGPTIKGAHSPDERLNIETVQKFWDLLVEVLFNIP